MIGPYWVDDVPSEDLVIAVDRDGADADLTAFVGVEATLRNPLGVTVPGLTAEIDDSDVVVHWTDTTLLETSGVYTLELVLVGLAFREALPPEPFVVQAEDGWHTLASARREWTTGAPYEDAQLFGLLESAKAQCISYAPVLEEDARVPLNYRQAQIMQARNLLNASKTDPGQSQDGDLFIIRPYPMDNWVKTLLRPKRAVGRVG